MRTFTETLKIAKEMEISPIDLMVASEVANQLPECSFEKVCFFIKECYLKDCGDITVAELVMCFKDKLEEYTEEELLNMRYYKFIDMASYYHE